MSMRPFLTGSLTGRFFIAEGEGSVDLHALVDVIRKSNDLLANPKEMRRLIRFFCSSSVPFGPEIDEDRGELSYDPTEGVVVLHVREERRSPSRVHVSAEVVKLLVEQGHDPAMKTSGSLKRELEAEAVARLLPRTTPKVSLRTVILFPARSSRLGSSGSSMFVDTTSFEGLEVFVSGLARRKFRADPVAWTLGEDLESEAVGFGAFSKIVIDSVVKDGPVLDGDVWLTGCAVRRGDGEMRYAALDLEGARKDALARLYEEPMEVTRLSFTVASDPGTNVSLEIDAHGVRSATPPGSRGGLLHEQLIRRFSDVSGAAERLREVVSSKRTAVEVA